MRTRIVSASLFAVLIAAALSQSRLETIQQVAPGVWFREGDLERLGHSNNIVIEMKDYLIVVDANYPSGARALMADIKRVSSKPVKYVFDTHHHGDHAYGNALWTRAGATTLAYTAVAQEMRRVEPQRWLADAARRKDVAELGLKTAEPPRQTFDRTPFVLEDSTRRVEFHFFGWAHTRGDGFVYLPKERILCTGDAVTNGPYNGMGDGNAANWPNVVRKARALNVKRVLPAHGPPGGPEVLEGEERFLTEIYGRVEREIRAGRRLDDLVERKDGQPVAAKIQLSPSVGHWVGSFLPGQIQDIYQQIAQEADYAVRAPKLERAAAIDGDPSDWKDAAFSDGVWDIARLRTAPWFDPAINRLTDHGNEPGESGDLQARYYTAWDDRFLYLGAEVIDNVNDVDDPAHSPDRWYFKDAICWFVEAPRRALGQSFGERDHALCFVMDARKPSYGAWWRHGSAARSYIEEPLTAAEYGIRFKPGSGDFTFEARVPFSVLGTTPRVGDEYGVQIVHTDPDGGGYGGHFLLYGRGDDDSTWGRMRLDGPATPPGRKRE